MSAPSLLQRRKGYREKISIQCWHEVSMGMTSWLLLTFIRGTVYLTSVGGNKNFFLQQGKKRHQKEMQGRTAQDDVWVCLSGECSSDACFGGAGKGLVFSTSSKMVTLMHNYRVLSIYSVVVCFSTKFHSNFMSVCGHQRNCGLSTYSCCNK